MKCFLLMLAALAAANVTAAKQVVADKAVARQDKAGMAAETKKFSWEASCEVACSDGSCKSVCSSGVAYGNSESEIRLQAEATLRSQANSQGVVKEGSIKLTIRGGF